VIEGAVNGEVFEGYVRQVLCPALQPGQLVVLDNLSSHHRASIRTLIEAAGCPLLFLSPYSPDFNPIEMLFSKIKAFVRGGAWRGMDDVITGIGLALATVTAEHILGWFKHSHPGLLL
jgi:DDE superfamily endonuclease